MKIKFSFRRICITLTWLWLALFALFPYSLILLVSLLKKGQVELLHWQFSIANYLNLLEPIYFKVFWRSVLMAAICSAICLLLAYPFAYLLIRLRRRYKHFLLLLIIIPFWTSSLVRTFAIVAILKTKGLFNSILLSVGLIQKPLALLYTPLAMLIGLVYMLLPFMILPLYASFEKLDNHYIDAARDLGASKSVVFLRIILPLTLSGISAGILLVFLPAMTLFYIPDTLGGAKSLLLGNVIQDQFLLAHNWPLGSALSLVLTLIMIGMLLSYWRINQHNKLHPYLL